MFQQFYESYRSYRWIRITCGLGLFLGGLLLVVFGGGFPPVAWRFLAQVVIALPALWATRGTHIIMPFIGLVLQSLLFLLLWLAWAFACVKGVQCEWGMVQQKREYEAIDFDAESSRETARVTHHASSRVGETLAVSLHAILIYLQLNLIHYLIRYIRVCPLQHVAILCHLLPPHNLCSPLRLLVSLHEPPPSL